MMNNTSSPHGPVFAKTIILGDNGSGRSSLIHNLNDSRPPHLPSLMNGRGPEDNIGSRYSSLNHDNNFFSAIELSSAELETPNQSAILKLWEYTEHLSKKDETMVFRGALFCVIVFNILDVESYKSVFDKWIPLKEQMSSDSFLYVVGTHLDQSQFRKVDLHEICKACAKKDAIYVEVSNLDGLNFPLLRKLLCKRVQYMINKRESLASRTFAANAFPSSSSLNNSERNYNEEEGLKHRFGGSSNGLGEKGRGELSISYLEPNIMNGSVGSILSSYFGLESWEGLENHEEDLLKISDRIDTFIEKLSTSTENTILDLNNISVGDDLFKRDFQDLPIDSIELEEFDPTNNEILNNSYQDLNEALKILGLSLPAHLLPAPSPGASSTGQANNNSNPAAMGNANANNSSSHKPTHSNSSHQLYGNSDKSATNTNLNSTLQNSQSNMNRPNYRKMVIKLPTGQSAEMILDLDSNLEQQIDLFLMTNGMGSDYEARRKLLISTSKMQNDYMESTQSNRSRSSQR
jgi:hypothetical protein